MKMIAYAYIRITALTGVICVIILWSNGLRIVQASGNLDPAFGTGGRQIVQIAAQQRDFAKTVAIQRDGKIVVGGELGDFLLDTNVSVLTRLNPDGSLDPGFGNSGVVINQSQIHLPALVIQPDGKIVTAATTTAVGVNFDFAVIRYNPDGTLDQSFGSGGYTANGTGTAQWILLQPDGKIVLVGFIPLFRDGSDFLLARFNPDGTPDQTFGINGRVQTSFTSGRSSADQSYAAALQADGKIVTTGISGGFSTLIRYDPNGSIDSDFGLGGSVFIPNLGTVARRIIIQPDGKIVITGGGFVVARFNSNGTSDQSFGNSGKIEGGFGPGNGSAKDITQLPNGQLLVAGSVHYSNPAGTDFMLGLYNPDGTHDQAFGTNGFVISEFAGIEAFSIALESKGKKAILAGDISEPGGTYVDISVARFLIPRSIR
jgi:uncharacterized delta-60 repeat protein